MRIAGREVKVGDKLYHDGYRQWGRITRMDASGSAEFEIKAGKRRRTLMVQNRGYVVGKRQLYWHEPIQLDLPNADAQKAKRAIDAVIEVLNDA